MELTFDKATGICEFEVTADFNLHLEREDVGTLHFYQRTTPHGEYDYIKNQGYNADDKVIDLDFQSLVYPKWIMIKSAVIPTVATITTDGEVREVSYQAKDIEITSNGTTKVTADTGYTALGSVNVKVNVPTEGGGSGVEADDIIYISSAYFNGVINLSKATAIVGIGEELEEMSIEDGTIKYFGAPTNLVNLVFDNLSNGYVYIPIKKEKILTSTLSGESINYACADSEIKVVGLRYIDDVSDETEEITGTLIYQRANYPQTGINVNDSIVIMDGNFIKINKIIASNGREYIYEQE